MKPGVKTTEFAIVVMMVVFGGMLVWRDNLTEGITMATTFAGTYIGIRAGTKIGNGTTPAK